MAATKPNYAAEIVWTIYSLSLRDGLLDRTERGDFTYTSGLFSLREIADDIGVKTSTLRRSMNNLVDCGIVAKYDAVPGLHPTRYRLTFRGERRELLAQARSDLVS
jgi:predicted ArsR family transcriptional regulator